MFAVYQTTNLANGKIYVGVHKFSGVDNRYLGSGVALHRAIRKYGRESFKRDILYECDTEEEMYQKEREIVNREFVNRSDTYNLTLGGVGFNGDSVKALWTPERRRKQSIAVLNLRPQNKGRVLNLSDNERKSRSERKVNLGRVYITHPESNRNKLIFPELLDEWKSQGWVEGMYRKNKPIGRPATGTSRVALWRHKKKAEGAS